MAGLTRKCKAGGTFRVGTALVRIVRTGRKATINIIAPPDVEIEYHEVSDESDQHACINSGSESTDQPPNSTLNPQR